MDVSGPVKSITAIPAANRSAVEGIQEQLERLDRNVAEIARGEPIDGDFPIRALVEQSEIARAVKANARALETTNGVLGTILDIKV